MLLDKTPTPPFGRRQEGSDIRFAGSSAVLILYEVQGARPERFAQGAKSGHQSTFQTGARINSLKIPLIEAKRPENMAVE
jgi:hypothetical protein